MINCKIILLLSCLYSLISLQCFSQEYNEVQITKIEYEKPNKKHGIRYHLPSNVTKFIDSAIYQSGLDKGVNFSLEVSYEKDTVEILGHSSFAKDKKEHGKNVNARLLKYTNRYIRSNGRIIPIYFSLDNRFSFATFATTGYSFYVKFYEKNGISTIVEADINQ